MEAQLNVLVVAHLRQTNVVFLVIFPGTSYGQKRPPLTDILKSILERYPDGGQILKVGVHL